MKTSDEYDSSVVTILSLRLQDIEMVCNDANTVNYLATLNNLVTRHDRRKFLVKLVDRLAGKDVKPILLLFAKKTSIPIITSMIKEAGITRADPDARIALMMAWHHRLGQDSPLRRIPKDVGKMIARLLTKEISFKESDVNMDTFISCRTVDGVSVIVLAEPHKYVERIPNIRTAPKIIDIVDNSALFRKMAKPRREFYLTRMMKISETESLDDI